MEKGLLNNYAPLFSVTATCLQLVGLGTQIENRIGLQKSPIGCTTPVEVESFSHRVRHTRIGIAIANYCRTREQFVPDTLLTLPSICRKHKVYNMIGQLLCIGQVGINNSANGRGAIREISVLCNDSFVL